MKPNHDEDRVMDHEYDGIREYDNPMPRWWLATLWGTVIFSVLYLLNLPVVGKGPGRIAEYLADSAAAAAVQAAHDPIALVTEADLMAAGADPARIAAGKALFATNCAACHLADGGGSIGPNLTDGYWIHGATPLEVFHTIARGVADKGMPTWGAILPPDQLVSVAAYVRTLQGTRPAVAKPPQGVRADSSTAR